MDINRNGVSGAHWTHVYVDSIWRCRYRQGCRFHSLNLPFEITSQTRSISSSVMLGNIGSTSALS